MTLWLTSIEHGDIRWWKKISWKGIDWINGFLYLCFNKLVEWWLWICSWVHSCLEVATFESRVAELKPCVPDLEMYTSEQLQNHAVKSVTAAWVNQSKSLFHCTGGDWLISCYDYIWSWMIEIRFVGLTILVDGTVGTDFFRSICLLLQHNMS